MRSVLFVTLIVPVALPIAEAQSPGTFTPTGAMAASRVGHTATLLSTGKVLITGGIQGNTFLGSAELYDPTSGTFSATGGMTTPRSAHTATLLADGRVLIIGGFSAFGQSRGDLASAELYDPATGTFTRTGDMTQGRSFHAAALLANGKVLIAGGRDNSAELYDPSTGTFSAAGQFPLLATQLTLLADGKVLIQGTDRIKANAAVYDPATSTVAATGAPPADYAVLNANLLTSGKVLDAAFDDCGWWTDAAELFDPSTGAFTAEKLIAQRRDAAATLLSDGSVLVAGGGDTSTKSLSYVGIGNEFGAEIYDPVLGKFSATGDLTESLEGHTATLLTDGTVLIAGGGAFGNHAEIYHPKAIVPAPVLLSVSGGGEAAILHAATQQLVSPDNPAVGGEALEIFSTGLIDGGVIPPQVAIGGRMADVLFFGKAPGYSGLNQINVRVPSGVAPGPAVPVRLNYLARPSNAVTIAVQ